MVGPGVPRPSDHISAVPPAVQGGVSPSVPRDRSGDLHEVRVSQSLSYPSCLVSVQSMFELREIRTEPFTKIRLGYGIEKQSKSCSFLRLGRG